MRDGIGRGGREWVGVAATSGYPKRLTLEDDVVDAERQRRNLACRRRRLRAFDRGVFIAAWLID